MTAPNLPIPPDDVLLRRYATQTDRDALGELIQRYAGLVYTAARRQVRDPDLAEDIMQNVFVTFARRAHEIRSAAALGTWLLQTTRYTSANAMKTEHRRRIHEQSASLFRLELADKTDPVATAIAADEERQWQAIYPLLDEAMSRLATADQTAVVLRFLRGLSLHEVAQATGTTEEGARKRVTRAIDRLRKQLAGAGAAPAACGAAALMTLLADRAVEPAPAVAITHATSAAIAAGSAAKIAGGSFFYGAIAMTTRTKLAAAAAVLVLLIGGTIGILHLAGIDFSSGATAPLTVQTLPTIQDPACLAAYRLADAEFVKFVPAPFITQRLDFIKTQRLDSIKQMRQALHRSAARIPNPLFLKQESNPAGSGGQPVIPDQLILEQESNWSLKELSANYFLPGMVFASGMSNTTGSSGSSEGTVSIGMKAANFRTITEKLTGLNDWQITGDGQLLDTQFIGDWVVRQGASTQQILDDLARILNKQSGVSSVFTRSQAQKDVVVIQGQLRNARPSNGGYSMQMRNDSQGQHLEGAAPISSLANILSRLFILPVQDETMASSTQIVAYHFDILSDPNQTNDQRLDHCLTSLSTQTGLTFKRDHRSGSVLN